MNQVVIGLVMLISTLPQVAHQPALVRALIDVLCI
jgi:hypothetical protein